ncbi:uncharacterized protein LOC106771702 [Vigna radiata var. radiata]|uniref:Uncharacterized protein LOC106771702 n=1 Tax=Vigna radiata var. radiata TaxID=3916 RepID=A0A1S3V4B3_VIGRR|nr:uncharacterized protein LOC106771702 [Vigna radiata var. radiata]XP_022640920.1 uncharacterized protein LOC106771702 [Vigna radiata var. radiata]XP_022640921.1 uncharacterized protein LOC106771702 [Vigna radiata var. radiata]
MSSAEKVQHVTKKSSDELLRKFAEVAHSNNVPNKKKITKRVEAAAVGAVFVERRSLLPPPAATRKTALLRQIGIGGAHILRTRDFRKKSLLGTIEKTWRRSIEGAARAFMERHYHRHKRLINDIV